MCANCVQVYLSWDGRSIAVLLDVYKVFLHRKGNVCGKHVYVTFHHIERGKAETRVYNAKGIVLH